MCHLDRKTSYEFVLRDVVSVMIVRMSRCDGEGKGGSIVGFGP